MRKARRSYVTPVWAARSIRDQVNSHLSLGRLYGSIGVTRRHLKSLSEQLKVMNERLH